MLKSGTAQNNRSRRKGVLTLEWILLVSVMVIGIIGGLALVRNAVVAELQDLADAVIAINGNGNPNPGPNIQNPGNGNNGNGNNGNGNGNNSNNGGGNGNGNNGNGNGNGGPNGN